MSLEELLSPVSLGSMGVTAVMAIASYIFAAVLSHKYNLISSESKAEKWILFWLIWDAMIHFFIEGPFVILSLTGTVETSDHWTAILWKEYGKADSRWLVSDPTIVSLELLTVAFDGPLCLILIYAICKNRYYRHWIQLVLCVCELYGGWMTFVPDMMIGSPSLSVDNWLHLWIYLVFFNGIWVVVPLILMYQSWNAMKEAFDPEPRHPFARPSTKHYKLRSPKAD